MVTTGAIPPKSGSMQVVLVSRFVAIPQALLGHETIRIYALCVPECLGVCSHEIVLRLSQLTDLTGRVVTSLESTSSMKYI